MNLIRLSRGGGYLIPAPGMQFLVAEVEDTGTWRLRIRQHARGHGGEVWVVSDHASKEAAEEALDRLVAGLRWSPPG